MWGMGGGKPYNVSELVVAIAIFVFAAAVTDLQVWVLDRKVFQQIMMRTGIQRIEENISFLTSVPLLQNLSDSTLNKIADVLEVVSQGRFLAPDAPRVLSCPAARWPGVFQAWN